MKGSLCHEHEAALPAEELWEVYSKLRLAELVVELMPDVISKIDVEEGVGGVGTVLCLTFGPGVPGFTYYKEKFMKIDHEKRSKEAIIVEGGYLSMGFTSYLVRFEILEKSKDTSIIKSTIEYEVPEEHAQNASFVTTDAVALISEKVSNYLIAKKAKVV